MAVSDASSALNTQGNTLEAHLQDVPVRAREVRSGHDLRLVEPGFSEEENPDDYQDLVDDFEGAGAAVANITSAEEVMNYVFLGP